jgi:predicted metal-dependent HD superfamily phosphohydrolase
MIRGTADHRDPPDLDTAVLFDADLAVLGADPAGYGDYVRGVRAEYGHVDDAGWRAGRASVLQSFLDRPSIYATDPGRRRWESTARANITAELAALTPHTPDG